MPNWWLFSGDKGRLFIGNRQTLIKSVWRLVSKIEPDDMPL